jgi:glycosyltransferase involved in cell wall biosynthesis
MDFSIIIPTYNRADELRETIRSIARLQVAGEWELLIVDNNSTDQTRAVVDSERATFPAPLFYLFEREQGRYAALNTGIRAATGSIIATTDDDARVEPDWLTRAAAGLEKFGCDYVGGKVLPIWKGTRPGMAAEPAGASLVGHRLTGSRRRVRANLAWGFRGRSVSTRRRAREAFEKTDLFDNRLGRKAGTLRNQAQREWHLRARAAGCVAFMFQTWWSTMSSSRSD